MPLHHTMAMARVAADGGLAGPLAVQGEDMGILKLTETPLQLLRYRVDRIEHAVGEMQSAIMLMDGSLRPLSLASLKIKQALNELINGMDDYEHHQDP